MQAARQQGKSPAKPPCARYIAEIILMAANLGVIGSNTTNKVNTGTN